MYGTVARLKVKPGKFEEIISLSNELEARTSGTAGEVAAYVFKLDNAENEFILVSIFKDRESYRANSEDPKTDEFYRQYRALLEADPEWNDGEVVWQMAATPV